MKSSNIFLIFASIVLVAALIASVSATDVTKCQTLSAENGVYDLTGNIGIGYNATCLTFSGKNNMTLDCHGYNISYGVNGSSGNVYGVYISTANYTTIQNCNIYDGNETALTTVTNRRGMMIESNFNTIQNNSIWTYSNSSTGLFFGYSKTCLNNTIYNNYVNVSGYASNSYWIGANSSYNTINQNTFVSITNGNVLYLNVNASFNRITNNIINSASGVAMQIYGGSINNLIVNNTITSSSGYGIYLTTSANNNIFINNTATSSTSHGIYLTGVSNNTLTGNIGTCLGANSGINVGSESQNNTLTNNKGYAVSQPGILIYRAKENILNYNLGNSSTSYGIYISVNSTFNTLTSNNGTSLSNYGIGIAVNASNNIFTSNIGTSSTSYGIYMANSYNNVMTSNTGTSSTKNGMLIFYSNDNFFTNNIITTGARVSLAVNYSENNTFSGNTMNGYFELGRAMNSYFTNLNKALFYYTNLTPITSQVTGSYTLNLPNNLTDEYFIDNFALTEGAPITNSPIWFSSSTTTEKHIASNLTGSVPINVIVNIGDNQCSEVSKITYTTNSGIKTEYTGANAQSVCNNLITTGYVFNVEQATASNILTLEYGASGMANTFIKLTIGFIALAILGAALLGIKFIKENPEIDLKQWITYCVALLLVTMLGIVLMQYLAGFV